jgi:cyclomaltodextrinase / maltogenic alpha-amylase / neopullulanase
MKLQIKIYALSLIILSAFSCNPVPSEQKKDALMSTLNSPYVELKHPEWSKNATLYEANIRQFTPEGTFKAFESHLPRLKALGADIIWLMPIHPIGEKNRKGKLGSYYSVKDYYGINPEFGTLDDFKGLVKKIHSLGMYVIIDWVGNHSAWDNKLVTEHPEWYTKTKDGNFQPTPWYDWDDVIDFDYNLPEVQRYMKDALTYWVKETNIDGYRCDVAGFIPVDFWNSARSELDAIKPVFMLAEWESRDLHKRAFDATFSWSLWDFMKATATDKKGIGALVNYLGQDVNAFPSGGYRMLFTDNHDKNSWEGNQYTFFGNSLEACMVFCTMVKGIPLVYGGQEAGLNKSLSFFDKDTINWKEHQFASIYTRLFALKHQNQALWNGDWGGEMIRIQNNQIDQVISFSREKNSDKVIAIFNFGDKPLLAQLNTKHDKGGYTDWFTNEYIELKGDDVFNLKANSYRVLVKQRLSKNE